MNIGKHPTWLLLDEDDIIGVLSLMLDEYFFNSGKTRVRIFHCIRDDPEYYRFLMDAVEGLPENIGIIEMFLPDKASVSQEIVKDLGFGYFRTSYVMIRRDQSSVEVLLPEEYFLRPFINGQDEGHYANIRNTAFRHFKGSETPLTEAQIVKLTTGELFS